MQRLLLQQLAEQAKFLRGKLPGLTELALLYRELGRVDALVEDILLASLDSCILEGSEPLPRDGAGLAALAERKRGDWTSEAERLAKLTLEILKLWHGLQKRFKGKIDLAQAMALRQISRWCRANRHQFVRDQHVQLVRKLRGHFAYFGIRGNYRSMGVLRFRVERIWIKWLSRRSQRGRLNWEKAAQLLKLLPLPAPRISKPCY